VELCSPEAEQLLNNWTKLNNLWSLSLITVSSVPTHTMNTAASFVQLHPL